MKRLLPCLWSLFSLVSLAAMPEPPSSPKDRIQFYLSNYPLADPQAPHIVRAQAVFDRMGTVADRNARFPVPQLRILDTQGDPWAIALPDGYIVLSKRAVEIAYQQVTPEEGDARLAFILGHELAHLAKNDFWHQEVYQALMGDPEGEGLRRLLEKTADVRGAEPQQRLEQIRTKEWAADDWGWLYAAIAGYRVDTLLANPSDGKPDFFAYWVEQTQTGDDKTHPDPKERAQALRARMALVQSKVDFFHYGVRLAAFGAHSDALYFYREFLDQFSSPEVLNNLGLSQLQLARVAMGPERAERFCFPTLLDVESRADRWTSRGSAVNDALPEAAQEYLKQAVETLKQAVAKDPTYLPAQLNLAVVDLYLNEIYQARAAIEEARKQAPGREDIELIRAIALYQDGASTDMWPEALKVLERIASKPEASVCSQYNLARLLEERQRADPARAVWTTLAGRFTDLSLEQRRVMCKRIPEHDRCRTPPQPPEPRCKTGTLPWRVPVSVGLDLDKPGVASHYFAGWETRAFNWQVRGMNGHLYRHPDGTTALELNLCVRMVTLQGSVLGNTDQLLNRCGTPLAKYATARGEIWSYAPDWAAWVQDHQVHEVWINQADRADQACQSPN